MDKKLVAASKGLTKKDGGLNYNDLKAALISAGIKVGKRPRSELESLAQTYLYERRFVGLPTQIHEIIGSYLQTKDLASLSATSKTNRAIHAKMLNARKPPPLNDGWYSPTQARRGGTAIWADFDGNTFEVSIVTRRINGEVVRPGKLTDYLYIGPVYKWVANGMNACGMIARKYKFMKAA